MPDQPPAAPSPAAAPRVLSDSSMLAKLDARAEQSWPNVLIARSEWKTLRAEIDAAVQRAADAERNERAVYEWRDELVAARAKEQQEWAAGAARWQEVFAAERQAREQAEAALATERGRYADLIGIFHDWRTSHGHYPGIDRCSACSTFRTAVDAALSSSRAAPHEQQQEGDG